MAALTPEKFVFDLKRQIWTDPEYIGTPEWGTRLFQDHPYCSDETDLLRRLYLLARKENMGRRPGADDMQDIKESIERLGQAYRQAGMDDAHQLAERYSQIGTRLIQTMISSQLLSQPIL